MVGIFPDFPRGVFLAVDVHLINTSDSADALGANRFELADGEGPEWDADKGEPLRLGGMGRAGRRPAGRVAVL